MHEEGSVHLEDKCVSQPITEASLSKLSRAKIMATSTGSKPASEVVLNAPKAMRESRIDINNQEPGIWAYEMIKDVDVVPTIECEPHFCPALCVKSEDSGMEDPSDKPIEKFREVRDEAKNRVERLEEELGRKVGD